MSKRKAAYEHRPKIECQGRYYKRHRKMRIVLPDGSISAEPVEVLTTRYRYWLPKDGSGQYKRAPRIAYYRAADATWYGHASYLVAEHEDGTQEWADVLEPIAYAHLQCAFREQTQDDGKCLPVHLTVKDGYVTRAFDWVYMEQLPPFDSVEQMELMLDLRKTKRRSPRKAAAAA